MVLWKNIVLGIIQGLTEFLPVSSSGHLVVWSEILKADSTLAFDVALHFGSLIALAIFFWGDIVGLFQGFLYTFRSRLSHDEARKRNMFWLIVAAILPSGVIGVLFSATIEKAFSSMYIVAAMFLATAVLLFLQRFSSTTRTIREIGWRDALSIGTSDCPRRASRGKLVSVYLAQQEAAHFRSSVHPNHCTRISNCKTSCKNSQVPLLIASRPDHVMSFLAQLDSWQFQEAYALFPYWVLWLLHAPLSIGLFLPSAFNRYVQ